MALVVGQREQAGPAEGAKDLPREAAGGLVLGGAGPHLALHQVTGEGQQLASLVAGQPAVHGLDGGTQGRPPRSGAAPGVAGIGVNLLVGAVGTGSR
ncbi:hypothetical protein GCM10010441_59870 [Kitasatospora paracochleata]